jgi:hypothetical protein
VRLYHATFAVGFLASRPDAAEDRWFGRTLAEDLRWIRYALAQIGA